MISLQITKILRKLDEHQVERTEEKINELERVLRI